VSDRAGFDFRRCIIRLRPGKNKRLSIPVYANRAKPAAVVDPAAVHAASSPIISIVALRRFSTVQCAIALPEPRATTNPP